MNKELSSFPSEPPQTARTCDSPPSRRVSKVTRDLFGDASPHWPDSGPRPFLSLCLQKFPLFHPSCLQPPRVQNARACLSSSSHHRHVPCRIFDIRTPILSQSIRKTRGTHSSRDHSGNPFRALLRNFGGMFEHPCF